MPHILPMYLSKHIKNRKPPGDKNQPSNFSLKFYKTVRDLAFNDQEFNQNEGTKQQHIMSQKRFKTGPNAEEIITWLRKTFTIKTGI